MLSPLPDQLMTDPATVRSPTGRSGRASDLAALQAAVAEVSAGRATTITVCGPAGIGKTWLVNRLLHEYEHCTSACRGRHDPGPPQGDVRPPRSLVLRVDAHPAEADLPYAGLHHLLRTVERRVGALPEPQRLAIHAALARTALADADAFAVACGLHRLLTDLAEDLPLLVVIDDVQWLDAPTSQALFFATRRLDVDRVGIILTARSPHRPDVRAVRSVTIDLAPLDDAAARVLVRNSHPSISLPAVDAVVTAAQGLPLALVEIPAALSDEQRRAAAPMPDHLPLGTRLDELFTARVRDLSTDTLMALLVMSLEPLDADQLALALGQLGLERSVLDPAERAGLVLFDRDGPRFRHAITAHAVQAATTSTMRSHAHRVLAALLEDHPARRARHLASVVTGADDELAAAWATAATEAEGQGAWLAAGQAHRAAAGRRPQTAHADLRRAANAFARAGAAVPLVEVLDALVQDAADPTVRLSLAAERVAALAWTGGVSMEDLSRARAIGEALADDAPEDVARLRTVIALTLVTSGRANDARQDLDAARRLAFAPTDPSIAVTYDVLDAYLDGEAGSQRLRAWAESLTDAQLAVPSLELVAAISVLIWSCEPSRAEALLERQCDALRSVGAHGQLGVSEGQLAAISQHQGNWTLAEARFLGAIERCCDTDLTGPLPHIRLRYAALLAAQGRGDRCREQVDAALHVGGASPLIAHLADCSLGMLALSEGRVEAARRRLEQAAAHEERAGINQPGLSTRAGDLVEALWRLQEFDAARAAASVLTDQAERWGRPALLAVAARCRAMLEEDDEVDVRFSAAMVLHHRSVDRFEGARTELAWGRQLRRLGRKSDARPHLRAALTTFDRAGTVNWSGLARAELAACGERRATGGSTAADLTPRELEVAVAVARGASNPEAAAELCISRRTVEDHLGRVYRKLGVADRRQLARLLGPPDDRRETTS